MIEKQRKERGMLHLPRVTREGLPPSEAVAKTKKDGGRDAFSLSFLSLLPLVTYMLATERRKKRAHEKRRARLLLFTW